MKIKPLCAVDTTIILSAEERTELEQHMDIAPLDLSNPIPLDVLDSKLLLVHSKMPNEVLTQFKQCQYIGVRAHNTDYVDRFLAEKLGITIQGIPQVGGNAVAEHTFSLIMALTKQLVLSDQNVRTGRWRENLSPNYELSGKKLGIIGYGTIGQKVANIGSALGMRILVASKSQKAEIDRLPLEEVLRQSDIITLHASSKPDNEQLMNKERIAMMKHGAIIINTARGALLDYEALEAALLRGELFGAGLDVFPEEPVRSSSLCYLPNVICTPHLAYYTDGTLSLMNEHLIDNVIQHIQSS
ncbi:NAD(P)-dependent oxidoreductase [Paenibacillus sp. RC67]|uniref:2-hydroxyacid dehydrogenase n=1 Tax=Paenibacillus sp. RC67 TaxID=3039392 RepID=UPI0024AE00BF|nr:NAD(P)-dependent oxidoreductase [Paenibacillus sp. RC67]